LSGQLQIRAAREDDVELIFALIVELAQYERAPDQVHGSPELLGDALFGPTPHAEAVIAEREEQPLGFALFHGTFSTWECRAGLWLEDLYVPPQHRRGGVGEALLRHVASLAVQRGCTRLGWTALDWNAPALAFYDKLGAEALAEWRLLRLSGDALQTVATDPPGSARRS
jgi:GNAT superfamily N-acetyltransferase